jgi:hypothetical protein
MAANSPLCWTPPVAPLAVAGRVSAPAKNPPVGKETAAAVAAAAARKADLNHQLLYQLLPQLFLQLLLQADN